MSVYNIVGSPFRDRVLQVYVPFPSNTQFVKSGVNDAKFCATNCFNETLASFYTFDLLSQCELVNTSCNQ